MIHLLTANPGALGARHDGHSDSTIVSYHKEHGVRGFYSIAILARQIYAARTERQSSL